MKIHRIGIIADCLGLPFRESMEACAELGAEGVQLYAVEGDMNPDMLTAAQIAEKKSIIRGCGLEVTALCGDLGGHGFARREENRRKIDKSKRIVELALAMDCHIVTTHIGVVPEDSGSDTYKVIQEACNELAEYAHKRGAFFAIETGPEPVERLKRFLDSLSSRGVAVNYDPANLVMVTGDDPVEGVYTLRDYIVHTHAKDGIMLRKTDPKIVYDFFAEGGIGDLRLGDYFLETSLGQGKVDFAGYLKALSDVGYEGYLTIEREVGDNPAEDIKHAIAFLRSCQAQLIKQPRPSC